MSLASVFLSRVANRAPVITSITSTSTSSWHGAIILGSQTGGGINNQSRSLWQEVIKQVPSQDPNRRGELTFEDPDLADMRMKRVVKAEGEIRF